MPTSYKESGVDIEAGDAFVDAIAPLAASTLRPEVIGSLGGFSGLFHIDTKKYRDPLLVSSTDGVGTKLKLAFLANRHDTVGIDLVAMSVNDVVVTGAEPLFFLDYFATSRLNVEQGRAVLTGIAEGCRQAGCALLGGETAEMPGFYSPGEYDLAGFAVGIVERGRLLGQHRVRHGDQVLGLASTGLHSNGFSLVRRVLVPDSGPTAEPGLLEELLTPTRIYVKACLALAAAVDLHALAHITGSGLPGNVPRVVPESLAVEVDWGSWPVPDVFGRLERAGRIEQQEMLRTFNMGIGMVAILPPENVARAREVLAAHAIPCWSIGRITERPSNGEDFLLRGLPR